MQYSLKGLIKACFVLQVNGGLKEILDNHRKLDSSFDNPQETKLLRKNAVETRAENLNLNCQTPTVCKLSVPERFAIKWWGDKTTRKGKECGSPGTTNLKLRSL